MQASLRGGKPEKHARFSFHGIDIPGVLFSFDDDLSGLRYEEMQTLRTIV